MLNDIDESSGAGPRRISIRFGDELLEEGFTTVPNLVLRFYAALRITPAEMMFIIHVWEYWWNEKDPYPSLPKIAPRMNVSRRQAQKYVASLRQKGYLVVQERYIPGLGQTSNEYDFARFLAVLRLMRKVLTPLEKADTRYDAAIEVGAIFAAPTEAKARTTLAAVVRRVHERFPAVAALVEAHAEAIIVANRDTPQNDSSRGGMNDSSRGPWNHSSPEEYEEQEDSPEEDESLISNGKPIFTEHKVESLPRSTVLRQQLVENSASRSPNGIRNPTGKGTQDRWAANPDQPPRQPRSRATSEELAPPRRRGRPPKHPAPNRPADDAPPDYIANVIADLTLELSDDEHNRRSNITRAVHLWQASGLSVKSFVARLYEARSITRQQGNVKKRASPDAGGLINRMPYFFRVVEDLVGLKDQAPEHSHKTSSRTVAHGP